LWKQSHAHRERKRPQTTKREQKRGGGSYINRNSKEEQSKEVGDNKQAAWGGRAEEKKNWGGRRRLNKGVDHKRRIFKETGPRGVQERGPWFWWGVGGGDGKRLATGGWNSLLTRTGVKNHLQKKKRPQSRQIEFKRRDGKETSISKTGRGGGPKGGSKQNKEHNEIRQHEGKKKSRGGKRQVTSNEGGEWGKGKDQW